MEENNKTSYRSIFKATSLFGGVQAYQILVGVVKSKFIAILLGPEGVGILGLYISATDLVKQFTSLGLAQSAVRDVSEANGTGDMHRIRTIVTVLRKLVWVTGLMGTLALFCLSPILSKVTFGSDDYTIPLIVLSITLLMDQICAGQKVVLQGMRRLKDLAKASAIGSTFGLVVSIPFYYILGVKGIIPTLILNSITTLLISHLYSRKVKLDEVTVSPRQTLQEGKVMLRMGIAMSVSSILSVVSAYVLRSFLRYQGGVESVGIFTAGYTIIFSYVNMFFAAMATDFYPRLAAVNKDNEKCRDIINQQGEIGTLMLAPLLIFCIVFMPFIIRILYSEKFLEAYDYVVFAAVGMLFRFTSVLLAHLFLVKGAAKLYMFNEAAMCITTLAFNLLGFTLIGMKGLGLSFLLSFLVYLVQVYYFTNKRFEFSFSVSFLRVYAIQLSLAVICLLCFLLIDSNIKYIIGIVIILLSSVHAFKGLNQRMDLISILKSKLGK